MWKEIGFDLADSDDDSLSAAMCDHNTYPDTLAHAQSELSTHSQYGLPGPGQSYLYLERRLTLVAM